MAMLKGCMHGDLSAVYPTCQLCVILHFLIFINMHEAPKISVIRAWLPAEEGKLKVKAILPRSLPLLMQIATWPLRPVDHHCKLSE